MKRLLFALAALAALSSHGATNVVSNGVSVVVAPSVVSWGARHDATPTQRVDVAGAYVREGAVVRQRTVNGWEVCPTSRRMVIVQRLGGTGTAVVGDSEGDLVRLTSSHSAVVFTGDNAPYSLVTVRAEDGDVDIFSSHR